MDILLVEPDHKCGLNPFPWGTLAVGSYLSRVEGLDVRLLNASYSSEAEFRTEFEACLPEARLVGISCFSTDAWWVKSLADAIKARRPELDIVVGGPHPTLRPEQTAAYRNIDFAVCGVGEQALAGLYREIRSGRRRFSGIPGLLYKEGGEVRRNPPPEPPPSYGIDYDLLPEKKRRTFGRYFELLAGRGCSFKCAFCYNAVCGHRWQGKPAEVLADEIQGAVDAYDPQVIYFRDENFFHSKERIRRFVELYRERGFRFRWDATCRANYFARGYIDSGLLSDLESINCRRLKFGIESGSQRVLDLLRKGTRLAQIENVVRSLAGSAIIGNYSFLMGVPGETREEYRQTLGLIRWILDADPAAEIIGPQYYRIYPGGELYERIMADYGYKEPKGFEEWAECARGDLFGLSKDVTHPWLAGGSLLPKHADLLVLLARKPLRDLLSPLKLPALPFALLARLRLRLGLYAGLWDVRLAAWMFQKYVAGIYLPRSRDAAAG